MNVLLDTHILLWAINNDPKLSFSAKKFIMDSDNNIYYSTASIWEITIKHMNHPDRMNFSGKDLAEYARNAGFLPLFVEDKHVFQLETLKRDENAPVHNDLIDRLLIAQAKTEKMLFLTSDSLLPYYSEKCIILV